MPEIAWIMAPTTSLSSVTWPSISFARSRPRAPCASRSSGRDGRTHISPKSSPKSEMRLPWGQGIATIYDRDILFYAAGILREKIKEGISPPPKELVFQAADFYRVAGRSRSNRNYENLESSLERLLGTLNKTNLEVGGRGRTGWFTWLAQGTTCVYDIDEKKGERSMKAVRLVLGDWVYDAIVSSPELLSVPDSY